jgi:hypothetical protein
MGQNALKGATSITFYINLARFFPKISFSYEWIFEFFFCNLLWKMIRISPVSEKIVIFNINKKICKNVQIPCIFYISFWKMMIIWNHTKKKKKLSLIYYNIDYNFFHYIMYIIPLLYVIKHSWSFEILNFQMYILWIFKLLGFHIFEILNVFWCV